ncbi:Cap15 family cyclic dinucleotide receptor domain-containing protein [Elizabethkingia anophelis]|uniref:Cap15 family cyclic dinucleotide receptor domain-containing protein n=1 Tax=Elizabethkingia anophelis TaxID=1117645 RepID=UPI003891C698
MNFKNYKTEALISFIVVLAIVCNILYLVFDKYIASYPTLKGISNYIGFLSILGLMTLVVKLIDRYLWKSSFTNIIIEIPNLNGRYEGTMTSSYIDSTTNQPTILDCVMEISQTASMIHVHTYIGKNGTQTSSSETICEVLKRKTNNFYTLYYSYGNVSNLTVELNDHKGTAYLDYFPDVKSLKGNYFNERKNNGIIVVKFKSNKLIGRFNEKL